MSDYNTIRRGILPKVAELPAYVARPFLPHEKPLAGASSAQLQRARGKNMMADDFICWLSVDAGRYAVEVCMGAGIDFRNSPRQPLIGLTVFPLWGYDRENRGLDAGQCVFTLEAMAWHLASLTREGDRYERGEGDYALYRTLASDPASQAPSLVSEGEYWEMLEAVPPIYSKRYPGFLVGEALTHTAEGVPVYAHYWQAKTGAYYANVVAYAGE